jgi:hypothetical protein
MSLTLAARGFSKGYVSDLPRDQLPPGVAYRMKDWIPSLGSLLRKRGGWKNSTTNLSTVSTCTRAAGLAWAPFQSDPHLVVVADNGKVYLDKAFDGSGGTFVGNTSFLPLTHSPFWHNDLKGLVILQALGAAAANPKKYYDAGTMAYAVTDLGGTPPQASVGASWGDYLLLANGYVTGTRYSNRIWISGVGTPEVWSPGTAFEDMPEEIVAIMPMRSGILIWGYSDVYIITGDTPPPGGNWSQDVVFHGNGCMDGRSVALYHEYAIWANNTGVYKSDGYTLDDLTKDGGIQQRWRELVGNFDFQKGWSAAAGIYSGHYIIAIHDDLGNFVTCQVFDLEEGVWFEFTNLPASMFGPRASGPGTATAVGSEELFFALRNLPYASKISSCWSPDATVALDGDGTPVQPQIEVPFWKIGGAGKKQIRQARLTYDIRTAGASPFLRVESATSPEVGAPYTTLSDILPTTTSMQDRESVRIAERALGIALRITQVGASADTRLGEIELDQHVLEGMR